jgi:hypothetical protein
VHRDGAAGGAAATPVSSRRRFNTRGRAQTTPLSCSPPCQALRRNRDRWGGGGSDRRRAARLGFEVAAALGCCGWGQNPREALRRRLNRPRGQPGRAGPRKGAGRGRKASAEPGCGSARAPEVRDDHWGPPASGTRRRRRGSATGPPLGCRMLAGPRG